MIRLPGLMVKELEVECPLVWDDPADERRLSVFARVVAAPDGADRPYLVFLQGGPGFEAPRPWLNPSSPVWLARALADYQVVMLDQRGTGRSTPVGDDLLASYSADVVAEILTHLRADSIVRDAEAVREALGAKRWSVLGQSFGGFTTLHYLSKFRDSIEHAYFTGGFSAVGRHCDEIYSLCYRKMAARSRQYYRWFPEDRVKIRHLVDRARGQDLRLPGGDLLGESRLRSLGHLLGSADGARRLHWLLDFDPDSNAFAHELADALAFRGRNPLYSVIHESSYADGCRTAWSASRMLPDEFGEDPTLLTGEHVFPEWFEEDSELRPWRDVAHKIAQVGWPKLYDAEALAGGGAVGASAVYHGDVFVPYEFAMDTARLLPGVALYVTSEFEHGGLRDSEAVLDRLIRLAKGDILR